MLKKTSEQFSVNAKFDFRIFLSPTARLSQKLKEVDSRLQFTMDNKVTTNVRQSNTKNYVKNKSTHIYNNFEALHMCYIVLLHFSIYLDLKWSK